jgi:hypothetical protein
MIDTEEAVASAPSAPTPRWAKQSQVVGGASTHVATPLIHDGEAIFVTWAVDAASSTRIVITKWNAASGEQGTERLELDVTAGAADFVPSPPVPGTVEGGGGGVDVPAVFVNAFDTILAIHETEPGSWAATAYVLDGGQGTSHFTSGLAFGAGLLWVGDQRGRLFGLDRTMQPAPGLPVQPRAGDEVLTTPVVYTDTTGKHYLLFGTVGAASHELWIFDPSQPVGQANPASVATGQTRVAQLSGVAPNGVIYVAGADDWAPAPRPPAGQVFAINIDRATQALRDFIVESQLMQDFDDPPEGQDPDDPPTFARYQTHLTIVDDAKAPRAFEPVKLWADETTLVAIDGGTPVSIGPGDDEFATAQTGADGSLTITSGFLQTNGSDDTDMFATPLRVWAGFMDPYERVVVYPDREFHARVTTAQAIPDPTKPDYDNPDVVNLAAVNSYDGATLFTPQELSQGQPQNIAGAIQTMSTSVAVTGGATPPTTSTGSDKARKPKKPKKSEQPPLGAPAGKYLAYDDLPGGAYTPVNVAAARPASVLQPVGLRYVDDPTLGHSFSVLGHADATLAIDALDGRDWTESELAAPLVGRSIFSSFWHFIKNAAAKITHIVISIGKEIYAGIRFIVGGVVYFFKHPLQAIEDVVASIGTFFTKLAKLVKNVIEAISVLFHFDEIVKTHNVLRDELLNRINGDANNPTDYPGWANLITNTVQPAIDQFFEQTEDQVTSALDSFKDKIDPSQKISGLNGIGSTPTTLFAVKPLDNPSAAASSHSVQCTWAMHKMKSGQQQATFTDAEPGPVAGIPQALLDFVDKFVNRITGDGDLVGHLSDAKAKIQSLFHVGSLKEFIEHGVAALIDIVIALLDGVIAVANAFIDGLLAVVTDLLRYLFDRDTGLLTRPIRVPVLSALYHKFFQEDLTLLNLLMLVAAIPVTIVYRVLTGHYPAPDLQASGELGAVNRQALRNTMGILAGVVTIVVGICNAVVDAKPSLAKDTDVPGLAYFRVIGMCAIAVRLGCTEPNVTSATPAAGAWLAWGMAIAPLGLGVLAQVAASVAEGATPGLTIPASVALMLLSICLVAIAGIGFAQHATPTSVDELSLAAAILLRAGGVINPFKFLEGVGLIVAVVDGVGGLGSAACTFTSTTLTWHNHF